MKITNYDYIKSDRGNFKTITFENDDEQPIRVTISDRIYFDLELSTWDLEDIEKMIKIVKSGKIEVDLWKN